jgi:hypothetical protein
MKKSFLVLELFLVLEPTGTVTTKNLISLIHTFLQVQIGQGSIVKIDHNIRMYDPPMHSRNNGIQYLTNPDYDLLFQERSSIAPQCWKCAGTGCLVLNSSQADKADSSSIDDNGVTSECPICCNKVNFPVKDNSLGRISTFINYSPSGTWRC